MFRSYYTVDIKCHLEFQSPIAPDSIACRDELNNLYTRETAFDLHESTSNLVSSPIPVPLQHCDCTGCLNRQDIAGLVERFQKV